ncbi:MAG: glycosyltransferase family 2 protein [Planctomycetota bacterium]|jgi:GT2 family glycosyltransferase
MAESTHPPEGHPQESFTGPISAVVVNYQGEAYLEACIRSIQAQSLPVAEIIVVENASTDGSLNLLNTHFRDVEVLRMVENVGACTARNVGLRAAKYRWVLLVDNDVVLAEDTLEELSGAIAEHEGAVMAQPRSLFKADPTRVHYDGGDFHYAGLISLHNFGSEAAALGSPDVEEIDVAISLCLLADKKAVVEVGGFDEAFFILFEDLDLSHRLRLAGHRILKVNRAAVLHDAGTAGISFREGTDYPGRRVFFHSRNRWMYMAKCHRLWTLLVSAPGLLIYEAAWVAFAAKQGHLGPWWRGKVAFLRRCPDLIRRRRQVQRGRKIGDRGLLVGGPLTLSPNLANSGGAGLRILDGALRGWWALCRHLVV